MQNESEHGRDDERPTKRGRGRPRAFDREAALGRATRLFWQKGFGATSMADLTEAMGIGSPSLYAAFGSKEALYAEALAYYRDQFDALVWGRFSTAATARASVEALLMDSAAALSGCAADIPRGCMLIHSAVGQEGHAELGALVRTGRLATFERLKARLGRAVAMGELPAAVDTDGLSRFMQAVQNGMSTLARDGATRTDLEVVARIGMEAWDAWTKERS